MEKEKREEKARKHMWWHRLWFWGCMDALHIQNTCVDVKSIDNFVQNECGDDELGFKQLFFFFVFVCCSKDALNLP